MGSKTKYLAILASAFALMGQGCDLAMPARQSQPATPGGQVDAAVDTELDAAADIDKEERTGEEDTDIVENDEAELNTYTEMQYDLP